jgi:hypothetical protein
MAQSQYCKIILLVRIRHSGGVASDKKLGLRNYEYSGYSERSAAESRISAALKERFFAKLRMTNNSLLSAHGYETAPEVPGQSRREEFPPPAALRGLLEKSPQPVYT